MFSYSVLQHFSKPNVVASLAEVRRVLKPSGICLIQMPNMFGIRSLYDQIRRGFREAKDFEVRYWTPVQLKNTFEEWIGPAVLSVDGFFGLGIQASDIAMLPRRFRAVVRCSEALRSMSEVLLPLTKCADSLYITSVRSDH